MKDIQLLHPFLDRESVVLHGDHVTTDAGTGCVHTAPAHGLDDYFICKKHNIETFKALNNALSVPVLGNSLVLEARLLGPPSSGQPAAGAAGAAGGGRLLQHRLDRVDWVEDRWALPSYIPTAPEN